jgi:hypothetical protein
MSNEAFERAMHQIASDDRKQKQAELEAEQNRQFWARVRKVGLSVGGAVLIGVAFIYRAEVGQGINKLTGNSPSTAEAKEETPDSDFAKNLQGFREGAAKRDVALDEIDKIKK